MRFLIASGPTREPLDPVRYLSNYSTGTMGRFLAAAARSRRHRVTWVRCPDEAETARDLLGRLKRELPRHDVLMMAAAVCDVRPASTTAGKIKKRGLRAVRFVENPDVLKELARHKKLSQVFVGFALESQNVRGHALKKLRQKSLEIILAQKVTKNKKPFGARPIDAVAYAADGRKTRFRRASKARIAAMLVRQAETLVRRKAL